MSQFNIPEEVDIMLNKKEIEMINNKIEVAEKRLATIKNKESLAKLRGSNWTTVAGKPKYIGEDFSTDITIIEDYIYLLKRRLTLNE
ncbi:hypothetical protein JDFnp4_56 [Fusobacterium phage JD-Fnp4]|nr:hypothetical protein JDFnp4_56 [Fusobacterium phage JD-Fnp4]